MDGRQATAVRRRYRLGVAILSAAGTVMTAAGCLAPGEVNCADGSVCPSGSVCVAGGGCVLDELVRACAGLAELAACAGAGIADGICHAGACVPAGCGNRVVEPARGEVCDDGNLDPLDECRLDCLSDNTCGNGVVDPLVGEECDGDGPASTICRDDCTAPRCGDGKIDAALNEQCDAGDDNLAEPDAMCRPGCTLPRCGDGILDGLGGEVCDDGNLAPFDGCRPDCLSDERCGNGVIDFVLGEACDDGNLRSRDGCAATCVSEPARWLDLGLTGDGALYPQMYPRSDLAMAYDAARQRVVLFGGILFCGSDSGEATDETWEWDGARWLPQAPAHRPAARSATRMVYEVARQRVLLFGGSAPGPEVGETIRFNDTWRWDGVDWEEQSPVDAPSPRGDHALAYDVARDRAVLFGGATINGANNDETWEWDGTTWAQLEVTGPPGRNSAGMAFDPGRGRTVLFSGNGPTAPPDNTYTYEWDGVSWSTHVPLTPPAYRRSYTMVYDPLRAAVTIFGGSPAGGGTLTDTWSWDGTNWTQAAAGAPSIPIRYGMAYDVARQQAVAIAQSSCTSMATWLRGTGSWARPALTGPSARRGAALAAQPTHGQLVLFGGDDGALRDDTWIWDGTAWRGPPVAPSPSARQGHAMATDPLRANVVLFGGGTGSGAAADTWTWDGTGWQAQAPAVSPPPRRGHALAFDGTQVVLFGGSDDEGRTLADTWAWDGASWLLLTPATTPPARAGHAMAFDAHRAQVVLMGGRDGDGDRLADTWTWDGDTWTNVTPVDGPAARTDGAMTYDPARAAVVLIGGDSGAGVLADTWTWDGAAWTRVTLDAEPPPRAGHVLGFDPAGAGLIVGGGWDGISRRADLWQLAFLAPTAPEACAAGLDYDGDALSGCADDECWARCAPLCPPETSCPDDGPACGEGACGPVETSRTCADDCPTGPAGGCGDHFCDPPESAATCPGDCA